MIPFCHAPLIRAHQRPARPLNSPGPRNTQGPCFGVPKGLGSCAAPPIGGNSATKPRITALFFCAVKCERYKRVELAIRQWHVDQSRNSVLFGKNIASQQLLRLLIVDLAGEPLALTDCEPPFWPVSSRSTDIDRDGPIGCIHIEERLDIVRLRDIGLNDDRLAAVVLDRLGGRGLGAR